MARVLNTPRLKQPADRDRPKPELVAIGGGFYELPDGRRVQGKKAALEALA